MLQNQITRKSMFEVQPIDGGFAVYLATYEQVDHARTGEVTRQIVTNKRVSQIFGHKALAYRRMALVMSSAPFDAFHEQQ